MIEILALIGAIVSIFVIVCMLAFALMCLLEFIDKVKFKYRYKHRFDKPPTQNVIVSIVNIMITKTVDAVDWASLFQDISILKTIGFAIMLIHVKRRSNNGYVAYFVNSDFLSSCWRLCSSE